MATLYKRGDRFYLNWSDAAGQHRRSLGKISTKQAEAIRAAKEAELVTGVRLLNDATRSTGFAALAERYLRWHEKEYPSSHFRVRQVFEQHLIPEFGLLVLEQIDDNVVTAYKHGRLEGVAPGTVVKELNTLRAAMNKAVEWKLIARHSLNLVEAPQDLDDGPVRFYSKDQLAAIYATGGMSAVWKLLANTGLRRSEALYLRWENITAEHIKVVSQNQARTKSGKWRLIPLSEGAAAALEALKTTSPYVVPRMTRESLSRAFIKAAARAGVGGSMHWLRHTFISHLVMSGVPLRTVQVLAGHATIKTTERYAHLAPGYMANVMKGIDL